MGFIKFRVVAQDALNYFSPEGIGTIKRAGGKIEGFIFWWTTVVLVLVRWDGQQWVSRQQEMND